MFLTHQLALQERFDTRKLVARVNMRETFPNYPRHFHKIQLIEASACTPKHVCTCPAPARKSLARVADVAPAGDAHPAVTDLVPATAFHRS